MMSMSRMTPLTLVMVDFDGNSDRSDGERVRYDCEGAPLIIWAVGRDEVAGRSAPLLSSRTISCWSGRKMYWFSVSRRLDYKSAVGIRDPKTIPGSCTLKMVGSMHRSTVLLGSVATLSSKAEPLLLRKRLPPLRTFCCYGGSCFLPWKGAESARGIRTCDPG